MAKTASESPRFKPWKRMAVTSGSIAMMATLLFAPAAAAAPSWYTYFNGTVGQNSIQYGIVGMIRGGSVNGLHGTNPVGSHNSVHIRTYNVFGQIVHSAVGVGGGTSISHSLALDGQSACFWNRSWTGGTLGIQCRDYRGI